jgi:hypothetical protein
MPERLDESLFESPLPDTARRRRGPVVATFMLAVVVVTVSIVWLVSGSDDGTSPQGGASTVTSTTGSGTAPVSTVPGRMLVEFSPDPALLYYPTMLPDGWHLCRQMEDVSQGDRFCDPDDADSIWVQVALKDGARSGPTEASRPVIPMVSDGSTQQTSAPSSTRQASSSPSSCRPSKTVSHPRSGWR